MRTARGISKPGASHFTLYVGNGRGAVLLQSRSASSQCPADSRAAKDEIVDLAHCEYSQGWLLKQSSGIIFKCNKHMHIINLDIQ